MTPANKPTDRIEDSVRVPASPSRVWKMLTDRDEFGRLFNVRLDRGFAPGASLHGTVTHPEFEGVPFEMTVDRLEREKRLTWKWHPNAVEKGVDYSKEPTTDVEVVLEPERDATRVRLVESGFDRLPPLRRETAREANAKGWREVLSTMEQRVAEKT
jgi:uncharacterized protein YndB with AHSA1/START domain